MGDLELRGRIMPASNATFVGELDGTTVVYKPVRGERPLWDFPDGTLADREVAAHAVSDVPRLGRGAAHLARRRPPRPGDAPGVAGAGPRAGGRQPGAQRARSRGWLAVFDGLDDHDRDVTLVHEDSAALRRMAVFDVITNNADRKGGHVLEMVGGHRYGVDHGLTFHHEPKLRTVLWGWHGEPLEAEDVDGVERVIAALAGDLGERLAAHLTGLEIDSFARRCRRLLDRAVMPAPRGQYPAIPWPPF